VTEAFLRIDAEIETVGSGLTPTVTFADGPRAGESAVAAAPMAAITFAIVCVVRKTRAVPVSSVVAVSALSDPWSAEKRTGTPTAGSPTPSLTFALMAAVPPAAETEVGVPLTEMLVMPAASVS
jgi:hypothetical protein